MHERILIIDLGSRFTQLIARQVRAAGVYSEVQPYQWRPSAGNWQDGLKGIILTGADAAATQLPPLGSFVFDAGVPVLGIAQGMHAIAAHFGGQLSTGDDSALAMHTVRARGHTRLLDGIQDAANDQGHGLLHVQMATNQVVAQLPPGFGMMASSDDIAIAGIADEARALYGLQFHPELAQTIQGSAIVSRFVRTICGCEGDWSMAAYVEEAAANIREQVGNDGVLLGLSGGVDSSVAAALIHKAIGKQLTCVFVDHGLLRLNEAEQVMSTVAEHFGIRVIHVNARERFMKHLAGVHDPEEKRKIIGREFVEVFQTEAGRIQDAHWLAQGTIYPDVIESARSASGQAAVKSHHNVGGLPDTLNLQLLEPLRELFKDEVRELGIALGLPASMVYRHPFPGPGLGVRILGEVRAEYADCLRQADAIFIEELQTSIDSNSQKTWYELTSQAFAVFLPVRSVGVGPQGRVYEPVIALRAVQTTDFMTAAWAQLPYDLLQRVANRIIEEVQGVSRVVYDISGKPPATIEWE